MGTLLLYDADCGFCTRAVALAPRLRLRARTGPLQASDLMALGIDPQRADREIPAVVDGEVRYGHRAIAAALATGPLPARLAGRLLGAAVLDRPFAALYRWVADHRHSLPGGTAACRLPQR